MPLASLIAAALVAAALLTAQTLPDDGGCTTDTECMEMHGGDGGPYGDDEEDYDPLPMAQEDL
jgi:hypothetical protein